MARIRSIKPEFPQSESMGRVSRDARLCFIMLWTISDDSGRLRGNSRMLASLLFPYDDDAPTEIDGWLTELQDEGAIIRYQADNNNYVQICNWLIHQKIDKPSPSKIPEFDESSRILANPRERSSGDQGVDQGSRNGSEDHSVLADSGESADAPKIENTPPTKTKSRFADFWEAYPSKVARPTCEAKWKAKKLDPIADTIIDDIRKRSATDRKWLDGFIPNPLTYLNQERWTDSIDQSAAKQRAGSPKQSAHGGFEHIDYSKGVNADGSF